MKIWKWGPIWKREANRLKAKEILPTLAAVASYIKQDLKENFPFVDLEIKEGDIFVEKSGDVFLTSLTEGVAVGIVYLCDAEPVISSK